MNWLDELEARLEQQLETFLASNPAQDALLREQEARDRQARLIGRRRQLQREADLLRTNLLQRASEIHQWRHRVERARSAGAAELAARAEAHVGMLMEQGRHGWQQLEALGQEFGEIEQHLNALGQQAHQTSGQVGAAQGNRFRTIGELEQAWAAFETEQELDMLRQRQPR